MSLDKWLYNFARRQVVPSLKLSGKSKTVGGSAITVLLEDPNGYVIVGYGATVPTSGGAGYAQGGLFFYTGALTGTTGIYINLKTEAECMFIPLSPVPFVLAKATVVAKAATDTTIAAAEISGLNVTNTGAGGEIELTLPTASSMIGQAVRFQITVAQIVKLLPQTGEKIYLGGDGVADKYLQIAGVIGNYAELYSDGDDYHVTGYSGVLTKQG